MNRFCRADDLLQTLGVKEPEQIDLNAIAFFCGADVRERTLDGCDARIIGAGDRAIITIDENSNEYRKRFSIGHELGHWLADRGRISFTCRQSDFQNFHGNGLDKEAMANRFAAELLMPKAMFRNAANGLSITFDSVKLLAKQFRTSLTATAIRIVELGSYPCLVTCFDQHGRRWYWSNHTVPAGLRPYRLLQEGSEAHSILWGGSVYQGPVEIDADIWIDHPGSEDYVIVEDSLRGPDDTILTLLWWRDEKQIIECY